jgi:hypothetical protein
VDRAKLVAQRKKKLDGNETSETTATSRTRDGGRPRIEPAGKKGMDQLDFAQAARSLACNPLGIIALFILLI